MPQKLYHFKRTKTEKNIVSDNRSSLAEFLGDAVGRRYSVAFSCIIEPFSAKPGKVEETYNHGFRSAILTEVDSAYSLICYVPILKLKIYLTM